MRIHGAMPGTPFELGYALGRRVTATAGGADFVGVGVFPHFLCRVADQAPASHPGLGCVVRFPHA